jgi:hypothetical protein
VNGYIMRPFGCNTEASTLMDCKGNARMSGGAQIVSIPMIVQ